MSQVRGPQLPARGVPGEASLPIPPNYIYNLQSRLIKVKKDVFPPTLKIITKTYYPPPARPASTTSTTVQPDDTMGGHRDGENRPQERPRAPEEEEEKVVANGTPSTDKGGDFISQTEVEMDHEPTTLADRHFKLVMTTAKSIDWGESTPFKQTSGKIRIQLQ